MQRFNEEDLVNYLNRNRFHLGIPSKRLYKYSKIKKINKKNIIYIEYITNFKDLRYLEKLFIVEDKWKIAAYNINYLE